RIGADADFAEKSATPSVDLERVAVDQTDQGLVGDEDVALVDVADDVAAGVDSVEGGGAVHGRVDKEGPVGLWEGGAAVSRAVEGVDGPVAVEAWHEKAERRARGSFVQRADGPGGELAQFGVAALHHPAKFARLGRVRRMVVKLGQQ